MRAEGKRASQGMPSAVCYPQALDMEPIKVLKTIDFFQYLQRPGENCGLGSMLLRDGARNVDHGQDHEDESLQKTGEHSQRHDG